MMVGGFAPAAGGGGEAAEEKTEFDVVMTEFGDKKNWSYQGCPWHHWTGP